MVNLELSDSEFDLVKEAMQSYFIIESNALQYYEGDDENHTLKVLDDIILFAEKYDFELEEG
jgi:hypothetical protein